MKLINWIKYRWTLPETEEIETQCLEKLNKPLSQYGVQVYDIKDLEPTLYRLFKGDKIQSFEEIMQFAHAYMGIMVTLDEYRKKLVAEEKKE